MRKNRGKDVQNTIHLRPQSRHSMYKAVFIDLDGTLLRPDHTISEETRETIRKLMQRGILVVLVSARPYHGILPISEWLGTADMPIVSLNGGYIRLKDEIIFSSSIPTDVAATVAEEGQAYGTTMIYYTGLDWYTEDFNEHLKKEQRITDVPVTVLPFADMLSQWQQKGARLNKVMAIGDELQVAALQAKLLDTYPTGMNIYPSKPTYLEIMRQDASKTNGVKLLLEKYGIDKKEILAVGDNFNDLEMIIFAGTGVAMGNAPDAIKEAADFVTATNEEDGVRLAIEHFLH